MMVESCSHIRGAVNYKKQKFKELLEMIDRCLKPESVLIHCKRLQPESINKITIKKKKKKKFNDFKDYNG